MPEIAINIPTTIKVLRTFKSSLIVANSFCVLVLVIHVCFSIWLCNFNILASGGGLVALLATIMFLSYSVPSDEHDILNYLKTLKPLYFEGGNLGMVVSSEEKLSKENERISDGNNYLKIQAMYIIWSVVGTLLWAYAGYIHIPNNPLQPTSG